MRPEDLIGAIVKGVLGGGGRKRGSRTLRHLTGGSRSLVTPTNVLAAAGLAWGVYEAATRNRGTAPAPGAAVPPVVPPPVPTAPPPIPGGAAASADPSVPAEVLRLVRLTISAARADGALTPEELHAIMTHAREVGGEEIVEREIASARPLLEIVGGVVDLQERKELYALAYAIVRADEGVSGAERVYLAQLAHTLGLDDEAVRRLEQDTDSGIERTPGA